MNYLAPLVTIPVLTRRLGTDSLGRVMFTQSLMLFISMIADFGFSLSTMRDIAALRTDTEKVSRRVTTTLVVQGAMVSLGAVLALVALPVALSGHDISKPLIITGLGILIGNTLFPIWVFQALERMTEAMFVQVAGKILQIVPIFVFVHEPSDERLAVLIFSASALITAAGGLVLLARMQIIRPHRLTSYDFALVTKDAGWIFLSRIATAIYTLGIPVVIGFITGPQQVALFGVADKIRSAAQSLFGPINQALFPRMSYLVTTDRVSAWGLLKRSATLSIGASIVLGLALWTSATPLVRWVAGPNFLESAEIVRWLAFVPVAVTLSTVAGIQLMLPLRMNRAYSLTLLVAAVLCGTLAIPSITQDGGVGAAKLILLVESVIAAMFLTVAGRYLSRQRRPTLDDGARR